MAFDTGVPQRNSSAHLVINVVNVNDMTPEFGQVRRGGGRSGWAGTGRPGKGRSSRGRKGQVREGLRKGQEKRDWLKFNSGSRDKSCD